MIGRTNTGGGGSGCTLVVSAPANVTVTVSKDGRTYTKNSKEEGKATFRGLTTGKWTVTISDGSQTATKTVTITADCTVTMSFNTIPEFTYTGDYEIVNDDDDPITVSQDNWKIRFLTSGTLKFTNLNGAEDGIDVFLVGGGGPGIDGNPGYGRSGGGGGYTITKKKIQVSEGTSYDISVGAGGAAGSWSDGGKTLAFGYTANGGCIGNGNNGGDGGSGGGGGAYSSSYANEGGYNGSDGGAGFHGGGGAGQGTTTGEFGNSSATKYAAGGGGGDAGGAGSLSSGGNGSNNGNGDGIGGSANANTGCGGGGGTKQGGSGGSGIVIIRNARG